MDRLCPERALRVLPGADTSWRTSAGHVFGVLRGAVTWARLWVPAPSTRPLHPGSRPHLAPSGPEAARASQVGSRKAPPSVAADALVTETADPEPLATGQRGTHAAEGDTDRHVCSGNWGQCVLTATDGTVATMGLAQECLEREQVVRTVWPSVISPCN